MHTSLLITLASSLTLSALAQDAPSSAPAAPAVQPVSAEAAIGVIKEISALFVQAGVICDQTIAGSLKQEAAIAQLQQLSVKARDAKMKNDALEAQALEQGVFETIERQLGEFVISAEGKQLQQEMMKATLSMRKVLQDAPDEKLAEALNSFFTSLR